MKEFSITRYKEHCKGNMIETHKKKKNNISCEGMLVEKARLVRKMDVL